MRSFMVMNMPSRVSLELSEHTVITNVPVELLQLYDRESLLTGSVFVRQLRSSTLPFILDANMLKQGRDATSAAFITKLLERFDMPNSAWLPVHEVTGARGALSLWGSRGDFSRLEMAELSYIAAHIFDRLADIRRLDTRVPETLTDREIDCLNWTAAGKTSAEIADILILSEHTVNHYLNRATKKLDTVNRTQAVAKALRVGLIK
jgi:DNA-binding CsgD family transcriptional regulator